jgi:hypothetical protein
MKNKEGKNASNMGNGTPEWVREAGRRPFQMDGFTPELMARIELAAEKRSAAGRRFLSLKSFSIAGLSAVLLFGILVWPLGGLGKARYTGEIASLFKDPASAAVQPSASPSASPSAASQGLGLYMSSAEFELGGQKYYMPMPLDRNKERAKAVETSRGIVWSPPPPIVDYLKPKYTHNTEPYTLYLTPKGHSELSADSAKRLYTFPLYAGGAQTYFDLAYIFGAGDYLLFINSAYTLGKGPVIGSGKISALDLRDAAAGEVTAPKDLFTFTDSSYTFYRSFIAVDQDREELLLVDYKEDGKGGFTQSAELYNIASGSTQTITGTVTTEEKVRTVKVYYGKLAADSDEDYYVAHYEVKGEKRSVEINMLTGEQWFADWYFEEYGEKYDPSKFVN